MDFHSTLHLEATVTCPAPAHIPRSSLLLSVTTQTSHSPLRSGSPGKALGKHWSHWTPLGEHARGRRPRLPSTGHTLSYRKSFILTFGTVLGTPNSETEAPFRTHQAWTELVCTARRSSQDPIICVISDQQKMTWLSSSAVESCTNPDQSMQPTPAQQGRSSCKFYFRMYLVLVGHKNTY